MNNEIELETNKRPQAITFGDHDEWAVSLDDGCLRFHPNYKEKPEGLATHIWREAFLFVFEQGGFDALRDKLRRT